MMRVLCQGVIHRSGWFGSSGDTIRCRGRADEHRPDEPEGMYCYACMAVWGMSNAAEEPPTFDQIICEQVGDHEADHDIVYRLRSGKTEGADDSLKARLWHTANMARYIQDGWRQSVIAGHEVLVFDYLGKYDAWEVRAVRRPVIVLKQPEDGDIYPGRLVMEAMSLRSGDVRRYALERMLNPYRRNFPAQLPWADEDVTYLQGMVDAICELPY